MIFSRPQNVAERPKSISLIGWPLDFVSTLRIYSQLQDGSLEAMAHLKEWDEGVSKFIGIYSDAVEANGSLRWLFTSGTPGLRPDGTLPPDIEGQTRQAWANIFAALAAAGMKPNDLIKVTTTLIHEEDIAPCVKVRKELLPGSKPALMLTVAKQLLKPEFLVEIEIVAAAPAV